jgi:hypothetical protein
MRSSLGVEVDPIPGQVKVGDRATCQGGSLETGEMQGQMKMSCRTVNDVELARLAMVAARHPWPVLAGS